MTQALILAAIEKRLATLTPAMPTAGENSTYTPVTGTAYQSLQYVGEVKDSPGVTNDSWTRIDGIYQVTLCYPSGTGAVAARTRADLVSNHFKRGTVLIESGIKVQFNAQPQINAPLTPTGWYCLPVRLFYTVVKNSQ